MNDELREEQRLVWLAATNNADNPLGEHLLDAHFERIQAIAQRHTREVLERLKSKLAPSGMSFVEIDEEEAIQAIDAELAKLTQETEK